jgi:hypothetical protein
VNKYEASCGQCGNVLWFFADEEPDLAACVGCGADAFAISLIGTRFEP